MYICQRRCLTLFISRQTFRNICTKTNIFKACVSWPHCRSRIHSYGCSTQSLFIRSIFPQYFQSFIIQTLHLQPSINPPNFSTIYSTTASGPLSTCSPCGNAKVLTFGLISRARDRTSSLCSGVHIEAVNCGIDESKVRRKETQERRTYDDIRAMLF